MLVNDFMDALPRSWGFSHSDTKTLDGVVLCQIPITARQENFSLYISIFAASFDRHHVVLFLAAGRQKDN